uniref:Uncharacterized protein n=1 Tax=viral metagenome TaxID=1070528 RepID=A0A6M3LIY1_9ZZZZ
MKISYTTTNKRLTVELEADSPKALWKELSQFQEVFEETTCGKCGCPDLRFAVRKASDEKGKEYEYHELRCKKCWAKLAYGVLDDGKGGLFPKRAKGEDGKVKDRGWVKWNPATNQEE